MKQLKTEQALLKLQSLTKFGINLGLQRITSLLGLLGNPQDRLCCIHIGGTNGKGSTGAILAAVLQEAGYRVGAFTSPHLESYTERFTVNGQPISEADLALYLDRVLVNYEKVREETGEAPTEFEVLTAMAFLYFADEQVDVLLLEVGLGGDIDSTNVITSPLLSVITNVTLDHCAYLGDSPRAIAEKKSGIIKAGRPVITASSDTEVLAVLGRAAALKGAPLHEVYSECSWELLEAAADGQIFRLTTPRQDYRSLFLALQGRHQLVNAATAALALELLQDENWQIPQEALRRGLAKVHWPGRLELIRERPWVVLDGAHNPAGLEALAEWLEGVRPKYKKIVLVIGMLDDKDHQEAALLDRLADLVIITQPPSPRALGWDSLAANFTGVKPVWLLQDPAEAMAKALEAADSADLVLVTGSLYLIGEVRPLLK